MQRVPRTVVLFLTLLLASATARAQDEDMIRPISRAHIKEFSKLLELNDEQVQVVEMLHQGYMQALQRENAEVRRIMEEAQRSFSFDEMGEEPDLEAMQRAQDAMMKAQEVMAEAAIKHIKTNLRLQEELFSDMRAMLEPGQVEVFPRVERMRRRQMILQEMEVAWSQVDLVDCLDTLEISSEVSPEFHEGVIRYEIAIDRTLSEMLRFVLEMLESGAGMMTDPDMEEIQKMMETFFGSMVTIRTVNKEHARKLGAFLSDPDRARFETECEFRAFPSVYRQSDTSKAIDVAAGLGDLTGDQPERIQAIRVRYERELGSVNAIWAAALDEEADEFDFESVMLGMLDDEVSESAKAERARDELDKNYRERLEAVLTAEQIERLPMSREHAFDMQFAEQERLQRELEESGEIILEGPGGG